MLHTTIGIRRRARTPAGTGRGGAPVTPPRVRSRGQTRQLSHTRTKLKPARPTKTGAQPYDAPTHAPTGAPTATDTRSPETTVASQDAQRSGGTVAHTSASIDGET